MEVLALANRIREEMSDTSIIANEEQTSPPSPQEPTCDVQFATNAESPRSLSKKRKRPEKTDPTAGDDDEATDTDGEGIEVEVENISQAAGDSRTGDNPSHPSGCERSSGSTPNPTDSPSKEPEGTKSTTGNQGAASDCNEKGAEGITPGAKDAMTGDNPRRSPVCESSSGSVPNPPQSHAGSTEGTESTTGGHGAASDSDVKGVESVTPTTKDLATGDNLRHPPASEFSSESAPIHTRLHSGGPEEAEPATEDHGTAFASNGKGVKGTTPGVGDQMTADNLSINLPGDESSSGSTLKRTRSRSGAVSPRGSSPAGKSSPNGTKSPSGGASPGGLSFRKSSPSRTTSKSGGASLGGSLAAKSAAKRSKSKSGGSPPGGSPAGKKSQRRRFTWSESLEEDFNKAVFDIGLTCATPKLLLERMPAVDGFTSEHIKSHLQKKRLHRQRAKEALKNDRKSAEEDGDKEQAGASTAPVKDAHRRRKKR